MKRLRWHISVIQSVDCWLKLAPNLEGAWLKSAVRFGLGFFSNSMASLNFWSRMLRVKGFAIMTPFKLAVPPRLNPVYPDM